MLDERFVGALHMSSSVGFCVILKLYDKKLPTRELAFLEQDNLTVFSKLFLKVN